MKRFNKFQAYASLIMSCLIAFWVMSGRIMNGHIIKSYLMVCTLIISLLVLIYLSISVIKVAVTSIIENEGSAYIIDGLLVLDIVLLKICVEFSPEGNILLLINMLLTCFIIVVLYYVAKTYTNSELRLILYHRLMFVVYLSIVPAAQNYIGPGAFMPPVLEIMGITLSITLNIFFAYFFYMASQFILMYVAKPIWRYSNAILILKDTPDVPY